MDKQKKSSFSKALLVFDYAVALGLVIATVWYAFKTGGYSNPMSTMADVWIGQAAVVSAMYLWKSKCENRAKYAQEWADRWMKDPTFQPDRADAAIRMAEMITKD